METFTGEKLYSCKMWISIFVELKFKNSHAVDTTSVFVKYIVQSFNFKNLFKINYKIHYFM